MTEDIILSKISEMPKALRQEALHYIEFLLERYQEDKPHQKRPQFGSARGMYKMSTDFDAPLDDFKDYM